MPELWLPTERGVPESDKVRVGRFAGRQRGRITRAQLIALGVQDRTVTKWAASGYLFPELPHVYAVGNPARSDESDLFSAVLYAGPYAALRDLTAALWRDIVKWISAPAIQISTPRRCQSLPADHPDNRLRKAIEVRDRRPRQRHEYRRIPTIPIPQIVLDLAATGDLQLARFALARLDFMRRLDEQALLRICGRGVPGSDVLRQALANQQPLFARAKSKFEIRLIQVCEQTEIPLPKVNEKIGGEEPDAVWLDQMVAVECDGEGNHGTWRQRKRDMKKDMVLRRLGFLIIRYAYEQLNDPWAIHADLMSILREREGRARQRLSA
jgi:very-short-patch-repair endonuclease